MAEERTAAYFLRVWNDASRSSKPDAGAALVRDSSPEALDTEKSSRGFALVGPDRLSASYPHVSTNMHDVGIVQADRPAPRRRMVYYFEIFVKNAAAPARVSIGFASATCPNLRHHPGCGYFGFDGRVYNESRGREPYDQTAALGDTLGCGVNYATGEFFFTKNGFLLGNVWNNLKGRVFPTIGLHSKDVEVTVNFGKKPFRFDLEEYKAVPRAALQHFISAMEIARCDGFRMIRSYLHHYGYEETLRLFDEDAETAHSVQVNGSNMTDEKYALSLRKMIHQMIMRGEVDEAITKLEEHFPQIMKNNLSPIRFFLHSQKFVELVRDDKLSEAIALARNEFDKFRSVLQVEDQVKDCASLLAYDLPHESYVGYLLKESHRELVADFVNATILSTNINMMDEDFCPQSVLQRLIRQLTTCISECGGLNVYQGEDFDLRIYLEESW